ncbi:hypothetical protein EYC84_001140 [Monilinia fructicola]|uniref:Uncharacterized protein n=1 Tax=Monilinia fructicola TaxID=38448 RepID=A0A5M9JP20_MONFR|nr:hypothetical protein EYC84_001140 [Monilinia fructicola]
MGQDIPSVANSCSLCSDIEPRAPRAQVSPPANLLLTNGNCEPKIDDQMSSSPPPFALIEPFLKCTKIKRIKQEVEYHFYGVVSPRVIASEAANFVSRNSSASKSSLKNIFEKFIAITSNDSQQNCRVNPEAVWFIVTMTKKSNRYAMPRWHRDGRMVDCTDASHTLHCRYAAALVGPGTRVLQETELVTQTMRTYVGKRKETSDALAREVPLTFTPGQIIRFSWGKEDSPVHSEPDLKEERVFTTVIYGSIDEIKDIVATRREKVGDLQAFFRTGEQQQG